VKSLSDLLEDLLADASEKSGADLDRDVNTLRSRVKHEGESFITLTLPAFCKDFERSLADGRVGPQAFPSFKKVRSGIPAFLQGLLSGVFDQQGNLLETPSVDCIRLIRQICLFGKKINRPCTRARILDATEKYLQCDDEVVAPQESQLLRYYRRVADIIVSDLDLDLEGLIPRHGPGATQEHISGNQKWRFTSWSRRLEDVGFTRQLFARAVQSDENLEDGFVEPRLVDPEDEPPVRVVFVPKTQKTPRVIAVEPVCMQYAQQGLKDVLVGALEKGVFTCGHLNFRDQSVNQNLAVTASLDGYFATLDMAEASDRVGLRHVEILFAHNPAFLAWVMAARSARAELPTGEVTLLKKFASMGSALCFPVEALVFYTSIIASRLLRQGTFPTRRSVLSLGRSVYVFGDDLIVPADEAPAICADLESLGFKVNRNKSFWTGKFRESCGSDCYAGEQVTPVYLRHDPPRDRKDATAFVSSVATVNQLSQAGYLRAAASLKDEVERRVGFKLPTVPENSAAIGWHFHSEVVPPRRWNKYLQRAEVLCWVPVTPKQPDPLSGDAALAKAFRLIKGSPRTLREFQALSPIDSEHLDVSPRRYALTLKRRWVPTT